MQSIVEFFSLTLICAGLGIDNGLLVELSMVGAIVLASLIMIVGMVPLSELISRSRHFSVTMLVVLVLIAAKLIVDGVGGHFPNGVLILMLFAILINHAVQAFFDRVAEQGRAKAAPVHPV